MSGTESTESNLQETRRFAPPAKFAAQAHIGSIEAYEKQHARSIAEPEKFWAEVAEQLHWFRRWDNVLEWEAPDAKWFVGAKTNLCYNCIDRQIDAGLGDKVAIVWEAEPMGDDGQAHVVKLTYHDLLREVSKFANVLKAKGVQKGDVVTIYMGMVPELAIAMLACARIGAVHSIIFGGFSATAIRDRVIDGNSKLLITCDGSWRRAKNVPLKANVDEALEMTDLIEDCIVFKRTGCDVNMVVGRDHWWHELMDGVSEDCPAEEMDAEDLLFILYTSGSTGKPKGIMHTTGGYMVHAYMTSKLTFDLHADDPDELYWCTADIGWITGHSYIIYGLLPNR
ncbi:MAG: AMP-binding protein, partial [Planctomycetota bacterium]